VCEYCGCQQLAVIGQLTDEHEDLRNVGRTLSDAANRRDLDAAQPIARRMLELLGPHVRLEEQGLFPELAGDFGDQLADLEHEHVLIEGALGALAGDAPPANWTARTQEALALLFDHILKEQDGVFPAALANVTTAGWERVSRVRDAVSVAPKA
jgi:hemerythrin-like domain-containing protein